METLTDAGTITTTVTKRLRHGCPNCGTPWPPGQNKGKTIGGLLICYPCIANPKRLCPKRIINTLKGLQWTDEELEKIYTSLLNHIACIVS